MKPKKIRPCGLINKHKNNLPNNETVIQQHAVLTLTVIQSSLHGSITNKQKDQLPDGLLAWLVELCTNITEVMGSNPLQPEY